MHTLFSGFVVILRTPLGANHTPTVVVINNHVKRKNRASAVFFRPPGGRERAAKGLRADGETVRESC
jgi:hypothetical protein